MKNSFPESDMMLTNILVVSDISRSKEFYLEVLGAELYREYGGNSIVLRFLDCWLLLVTRGDPTEDKPNISFEPPEDRTKVDHSFTIRVKDCQRSYDVLLERGAKFLTPPYDWGMEKRCFFTDPDGHLFEISEVST